jgi:hypothetical protein
MHSLLCLRGEGASARLAEHEGRKCATAAASATFALVDPSNSQRPTEEENWAWHLWFVLSL